jgi:heme/copper-type cytochrome/quinol oxidase subunit 2
MSLRVRPALAWFLLLGVCAFLASSLGSEALPQSQGASERSFVVVASRYTFAPVRIEVFQDDLVRMELRTEDIAHSLTIDEYRVAKRVGPGQKVTFEFRAERPGTFRFYCDLKAEAGCREMRGELVVRPRK